MERSQMCLLEPQHSLLVWLTKNSLLCGFTSVEPWGSLKLFSQCAHSDTKNRIPLSVVEWCAGNASLSNGVTRQFVLSSAILQQNIPMDFTRPCKVGGERKGCQKYQYFPSPPSFPPHFLLFISFLLSKLTWKQNKTNLISLCLGCPREQTCTEPRVDVHVNCTFKTDGCPRSEAVAKLTLVLELSSFRILNSSAIAHSSCDLDGESL